MEIKDSATGQTLYFNKQTGITLNERPGTSKASVASSKFSVAQSGASFASQPSVMPQQPPSQQFGAANCINKSPNR
ncbi:hypothetical protein FGO68_gene1559 [Halteria grandinella]|uniref:WW domain-containing protein n=1 Tax=Halteria grandinella TaxID=5974 RepID=A0A8J8P5Y3_HALGN|nr:hypothetical protein FGO68_gene1559 [Halteria grandinella]